jgi:hypothetical protein
MFGRTGSTNIILTFILMIVLLYYACSTFGCACICHEPRITGPGLSLEPKWSGLTDGGNRTTRVGI